MQENSKQSATARYIETLIKFHLKLKILYFIGASLFLAIGQRLRHAHPVANELQESSFNTRQLIKLSPARTTATTGTRNLQP